jgi:fumarate reductase (CoM/CoB) subunit B
LPLPESLIKLKSSFDLFQTAGQVKMRENFDRHGRTVPPKKGTERPVHGDLAFFPGCISDGKLEEVVEASLRLLQAAGYQPFVPANWACCGSPFEKTGDGERLRKALNINVVSLQSVETVVTSCPGCTVQLQKDHGKNVLHIIEFLHASAALSSSSFDENAPAIKVALHQPCHLARAVGPHTMDMVRDMLSLVPGVTIVEYEGEDECCGGGGGVASSRPEVTMRMAVRKITAARRADADVLLAPCPFCVVNLRKAGSMAAEELTTFLARRLVNGNTHK